MTNSKSTSSLNHGGISFAGVNQQQLGQKPASFEAKAPDMSGEFRHVSKEPAPHDVKARHERARREAFKADRRVHDTPVSRAELELRKGMRTTPKAVLELTPNGPVKRIISSSFQAENEKRINFAEKRLGRVRGQVKSDFAQTRR